MNTEVRLFTVEGMHCIGCVRKIQSVAAKIDGVVGLNVDLGSQTLEARVRGEFKENDFTEQVEGLGFQIRSLALNEALDDQLKVTRQSRAQLARLGVAGACAGNIMLLTVANYAGAWETEFGVYFNWLSFLLYLPILFYSAQVFYKNSWLALRKGKLSVDLPIAIVLSCGTLLSLYHLILGDEAVYFDSFAMFIFFLLSARYLIFRLQRKVLSPVALVDLNPSAEFCVEGLEQASQMKPANELLPDQIIVLKRGQVVPADAELQDDEALVTDASFTGESLPKLKLKFDRIYAGCQVLTEGVRLKVKMRQAESRLMGILEELNLKLMEPTQMTTLTDRGAHYLTVGVILLALTFLAAYWSVDANEAMRRVLALLVVACPCALAIASPLAYSLTLKKALGLGVLVRSPDVLENFRKVKTFVFDKTGTLTTGNIEATQWQPPLSPLHAEIVRALEQGSDHPIALAVLRQLEQSDSASLFLEDRAEIIGKGITGHFEGQAYRIEGVGMSLQKQSKIGFFKGDELISVCELKDEIDPQARETLDVLKSQGHDIWILSGDSKEVAEQTAQSLGLMQSQVIGEATPETKVNFVNQLSLRNPTVFVGDGVNDAAALNAASIGISQKRSAEISFKMSDIYLLSGSLKSILRINELAIMCYNTIYYNLIFAALYNVTFASLALTGMIDPLVAVIIMPLSSLSLVLFTIYRLPLK